jgi:opacity protein-like surface antigen
MKGRVVFGVITGALLLSLPAAAGAQDRRFHGSIGGGATPIFDTLGDGFSTGWGPSLGFGADLNDNLGLQFDYDYRYFSLKDDLDTQAGRYSANHKLNALSFGVVAKMGAADAGLRPYAIAGPGFYHRKVEVTEYVGNGIVCDPWLYLCGTYPIEAILGDRGGWDFGMHFGGGVAFRIAEEAALFFEVRYHYVWGPETQPTAVPASTGSQKVNGQYLPITFGLRF